MNARRTQQQPAPAHPLFDTAAESEVLGCLLLDPANAWPEAGAAGLTDDDFTAGEHRQVFAAAREQYERGQECDVIGVHERLRAQGDQDEDLLMRLHSLTQNAAPGLGALRRLARMLHEQGLRRKLAAAIQSGTLADALELAGTIRDGAQHGHDIELLDVGHMLDNEPPPLDFVLPGLLAGTVGMLVAAGATGKSMMALQLAATVAAGADTLGLAAVATKPFQLGRVIYLTGEDPQPIIHTRIAALREVLTREQRELLGRNLLVGDLVGVMPDLLDPAWFSRIARLVEGSRLVILDTLRRFHTGDENDGGEMTRLVAALERIARRSGTTVLAPHHASKAAAREGATDQSANRGHSVLSDNGRLQVNLARMSEKEAKVLGVEDSMRGHFVRVVFSKANYTAPLPDLWLQRKAGGVLEPAHFGIAGAVATRQPMPGARIQDSVRRGGVVINGRDGWEVLR